MIYTLNFADQNFEKARRYNTRTAYSKGKANKVFEYSPTDIDEHFKKKNEKIFAYKRGAGLWLWKPYFILKTLREINEGDYLFYCDAGAMYVNKISHLIECMNKNNLSVMLFELPLLERQFTKKETFHLMDYSNYDNNQILAAGYILLKKDDFSEAFIKEWLAYCEDERILSPNHFLPQIEDFEDFVAHREDQSVLSILAHKHKLPVFRDPSDYGDRPFQLASDKWTYNPKQYTNSPYPKIVISNRKEHPVFYKYKEKLKTLFHKWGLYTQETFFRKHNLS